MNTVMKEKFEECYAVICRAKQIEQTINGFKAYKNAMTSLYHAVCLDIDDTLTYKNNSDYLEKACKYGQITG